MSAGGSLVQNLLISGIAGPRVSLLGEMETHDYVRKNKQFLCSVRTKPSKMLVTTMVPLCVPLCVQEGLEAC